MTATPKNRLIGSGPRGGVLLILVVLVLIGLSVS